MSDIPVNFVFVYDSREGVEKTVQRSEGEKLPNMSNKENEEMELEGDAEDELSAPLHGAWITPRNSILQPSSSSAKPTPYANLRQLAGLIKRPSTPGRRKSSNNARRGGNTATPATEPRATPGANRALQSISGNRSNPTTPHAVRALQHRRNTPGFDRRKSGRLQRETPRDILRNLSKALVRTAKIQPTPLAPTPENESLRQTDDGSEDELSPNQPTLTLPFDHIGPDEDSFNAPPPRLSMPLDDHDQTPRSIEVGRHRSARTSMGDTRFSDQFIHTVGPEEMSGMGQDQSVVLPLDQDIDELSQNMGYIEPSGDTENIRKLMLQRNTLRQAQVEAHASLRNGEGDAKPPFVLQIPDFAPRQSNGNVERLQDTVLEDTSSPAGADGFYEEEEDPLQSNRPSSLIILQTPPKAPIIREPRKRRSLQHSRFGIVYPAIPARVTKSIANTFARISAKRNTRLGKETLSAINEAGNLFLTQLGGDLTVIARHSGRKNIDETDVVAAMTRQRHVGRKATAFSQAQHHLPSDLVHELRIPAYKALRRRKKRRLSAADQGVENDVNIL